MTTALEDPDRRARLAAMGSGRVPPHDPAAEEALLGAMLLSRDAVAAGAAVCRPGHFYAPAHARIFAAVVALDARGEPADPVTVADELRRAGQLDAAGGPAVLLALQANTPAVSSAERYARIVEELALLRGLIEAGGRIAELGYSLPADVGESVDRAESMVFALAEHRRSGSAAGMRALLVETLDHLERLYEAGEAVTGVPTGYADLDAQLSGLQPASLVVVAARPAHGKSAFALGLAAHAAIEAGRRVLFFSLEMSRLEVTQRLLAAEGRVDSARLRNGRLAEADWARLAPAVARLDGAPLRVHDDPGATVAAVRAEARRAKAREGLDLVVVNYLQLVTGRPDAETRQVEVSAMSRGLKLLARELDVPVVALSQVSRACEQRADKRPLLADLRESGAVEQDSDVVVFLYRDEVYDPGSADRGMAEVHVAKNRHGPTGLSRLAYLAPYTKFANMAPAPGGTAA